MNAKRGLTWLIVAALAVVVLGVGGTFLYLRVIRGDAPERLSLADLDQVTTTLGTGSSSAPTSAGPGEPGAGSGAGAATGTEGTWQVGSGSQAGYRVAEILFGQSTEAVGRTTAVTGQVQISGTAVESASFSVDLTKVTSDSSQRDGQFRGRIMDVSTHPTATFTLTSLIQLDPLPPEGTQVSVQATGDLTLRGVTRPATFSGEARVEGGTIQLAGSIPVTFADHGIPNPSFGPAQVGDTGELEVALVLTRGS